MSTILSASDVDYLVSQFAPLSVDSGKRPLVLRSSSGSSLVSLKTVAERLDRLLQRSQVRIPKTELAVRLGLELGAGEWICELAGDGGDGNATGACESGNGGTFVPGPEVAKIVGALGERVARSCVDLNAFAAEQDIDLQDLLRRVRVWDGGKTVRELRDGATYYLAAVSVFHDAEVRIREAVESAGREICDLSSVLDEGTPFYFVRVLGVEVAAATGGEVRVEKERVVHVPSDYSVTVKERHRQMWKTRIDGFVQLLRKQDYCVVDSEGADMPAAQVGDEQDLGQAIRERYQTDRARSEELHVLKLSDGSDRKQNRSKASQQSVVVITPERLRREMESLEGTLAAHVEKLWQADDRATALRSLTQEMQRHELRLLDQSELSLALCRSEHAGELVAAIQRQIEHLDSEEHGRFVAWIEARLIAPLHLYALGIETIRDATLKQHLEDFVAEHFRREVLPTLTRGACEQGLLRDKDRSRQMEKLQEGCAEAKTFEAVQTAVSRAKRRLKMDTPGDDVLQAVKAKTLHATVRSMKQMQRGSDLLQNVMWVLLSRASDGLFISAGKDTSRMIKQYEAVGDAETASQLRRWRDELKAGRENADDLAQMTEAARTAVEHCRRSAT